MRFDVHKKAKWAWIDYDLFADCRKLKPSVLSKVQADCEDYVQRLRAEGALKGGVSFPQAGCGRLKVLKEDADEMANRIRRILEDPNNLADAL